MIKTIVSSNHHLYTTGGSSLPFVSYNPGNPMQGMIRINGSDLEAFDGNSWIKVYMGSTNIGLNGNASSAIDWAIKKMSEEQELEYLAKNNAAVKIALDNVEEAKRQLAVTAKLANSANSDEQTTTN